MSVLKRLTVLKEDADKEPLPQRKYFHIGQPEVLDDVGECVPMISWVDDNLSRFVLSTAPSTSWGRIRPAPLIMSLPNRQIAAKDGIFLVSGAGDDRAEPHPGGKGTIHIVYLGQHGELWSGLARAYVYRLEGMQTKGVLGAKPSAK